MDEFVDAFYHQKWLEFINKPCETYASHLHKHIAQRCLPKVKACLKFGGDVNLRDQEGNTCLLRCLYTYRTEDDTDRMVAMVSAILSYLSPEDVDVRGQSRNRPTALHLACSMGILPVARMLWQFGADANLKEHFSQKTPLLLAMTPSGKGLSETRKNLIMEVLRYTEASVTVSCRLGMSVTYHAEILRDMDIMRVILDKGCAQFTGPEVKWRFEKFTEEIHLIVVRKVPLFPSLAVLSRDAIRAALRNKVTAIRHFNYPATLKTFILLES